MNQLWSPAFTVFNSENSESVMQRKPGLNTLQTRKPFIDRTANCNSPDVHKKSEAKVPAKENIKQYSSTKITKDSLEIEPENCFSYKIIEDQFEDTPYYKRLEDTHVFNILKAYVGDDTPPASPLKPFNIKDIYEISPNKSYDEDVDFIKSRHTLFEIEDIGDVGLPMLNMDDL